MKLKITHRALIQRINRKLMKNGKHLRCLHQRRGKAFIATNAGIIPVIDIEQYGRELGVIKPWEQL